MIILEKAPTFNRNQFTHSLTIRGRMCQVIDGKRKNLFYQLDFSPTAISCKQNETMLMTNARDMDNDTVLALLYRILEKVKNPTDKYKTANAINRLSVIFPHIKAMGDEPLDKTLLETDLSGKAFPKYEPTLSQDGQISTLIGGMTGGVFYALDIQGETFKALKDSSPRFLSSKHCSQEEVRFICRSLIEKYPENAQSYQHILQVAENAWAKEDKARQIRTATEEAKTNPHLFLAPHEKIKPFDKIGPVFYEDEKGVVNVAYWEDNRIYHITLDNEKPVIELLNKKKGKIKAPAMQRIMTQIYTHFENLSEKQQAALYALSYDTYTKAPSTFNHDEMAQKDIAILADSLSIDAIREKYNAGAYKQQLSQASALPERKVQNKSVLSTAIQYKIQEIRHTR